VILYEKLYITSRESLSLQGAWLFLYGTGINIVNPSPLGTKLKHGNPACVVLPHTPVTGSTGQKYSDTVQGEFIIALADSVTIRTLYMHILQLLH